MNMGIETLLDQIERKVMEIQKGGAIEMKKAELRQLLNALRDMISRCSWRDSAQSR